MHEADRLVVVNHVVSDLVDRRGVDPDRLMIVGSEARDHLHHTVFSRKDPLRGTQDVDVAIATDDWATYETVVDEYPATGANGVRFVVANVEVDFMPFGGVEDPDGVVEPAARREHMSVYGIADVFRSAPSVVLPSGVEVRFPTAEGYTLLKLRAWVDRAHYNDKDSEDLAIAVDWYCGDAAIRNSLWDEVDEAVFEAHSHDTDLIATWLLGTRAAAVVGPERARELAVLLERTPVRPRRFTFSPLSSMRNDERVRRIEALTEGFLRGADR
ncbi:hypothetical protein [Curtobacterium sp. PhB78]|uniref:hypothetical protein n=1 Tax=Curtobacterium sp. PhB78 TaxID=2485102 RepID=UPI000FC1CF4B|nr:hypothetical protein [Curtobacterium sp. PhB78]ROS47212.1 putative nucleotidyltransferase [Curtobacterium sp. PhB78]